ncbi:hypothetical protein NMY22_g739 [Coprinellus aureogranulatus]|nr:hypothetical protein NMY22_g739 [Coprinellus aureogranulatus]
MPAPVVYVLAAVVTVGAVWMFKELVYVPHVHPHVAQWAEGLQEERRRRRRTPARPHAANGNDAGDEAGQPLIPMPSSPSGSRDQSTQNEVRTPNIFLRRRRQQGSSGSSGGVDGGNDSDEERYGGPYTPRSTQASSATRRSTDDIELADLAPEVREWSRTSVVDSRAGMRSPLDEVNSE